MDAYMTTSETQSKFASRQDMVAHIVQQAILEGFYADKQHTLDISGDVIWVRENHSKAGVAFSSTRADFEQSLVEFVTDYFA